MSEAEDRVISTEEIENKIKQNLSDVSYVKAVDESDTCPGQKFIIEVTCEEFRGKPLLQQHRLVHKAIEEYKRFIHAVTLKTKAP
jgi:stress-induced morphogen